MYYKPPEQNGTPYYVPIVTKNRDHLIGYLHGINDGKDLITDALESVKIDIDLGPIDAILDSSQYNDILENGRRGSEMTKKELDKYIYDLVEEMTDKMVDENTENNIDSENALVVDCKCDLGYYAWRTFEDIPDEDFKCTNCGKVLIHYCGNYGYEFSYQEGDLK